MASNPTTSFFRSYFFRPHFFAPHFFYGGEQYSPIPPVSADEVLRRGTGSADTVIRRGTASEADNLRKY